MAYAVIIVILFCFIAYFIYRGNKNTYDVNIKTIELNHGKDTNDIPLRILHLSDLHLENMPISPEKLYNDLKEQPIDLIALTGDYLDRKRTIPKIIPYLEVIRKLNPTFGSYAVFGNHDYVLREKYFQQLKSLLNDYNIKTMQNENETIQVHGKLVHIIGIDDYSTNRSDMEKSYTGIKKGYKLVLTHDPNIVLEMKNYKYHYLLSGHFHGGQIYWPKPYHLLKMGKLVRMNMVKGLHFHHGRPFYISEGLGQTGVNIRIGSRPEITFHHISIAKAEKTTIAG